MLNHGHTGIQIWDTVTNVADAGEMLKYGTLSTAQTCAVGVSLALPAGALTVQLARTAGTTCMQDASRKACAAPYG